MGMKKGSRKKEGLGKLKDVTGMRIYRLRQPLVTWKRKAETKEANPEVQCKDHTSGQPPMRWGMELITRRSQTSVAIPI